VHRTVQSDFSFFPSLPLPPPPPPDGRELMAHFITSRKARERGCDSLSVIAPDVLIIDVTRVAGSSPLIENNSMMLLTVEEAEAGASVHLAVHSRRAASAPALLDDYGNLLRKECHSEKWIRRQFPLFIDPAAQLRFIKAPHSRVARILARSSASNSQISCFLNSVTPA